MLKHVHLSAIAIAALTVAAPARSQPSAAVSAVQPTLPVGYVGTDTRVGVTIDSKGEVEGEALGVFGHDGRSAYLLQGWRGRGRSGGLQASYHWLWGGDEAAVGKGPEGFGDGVVAKLFGAADRNLFGDRKATLGVGLERANFGLDLYLSRAMSHERAVGQSTTTTVETVLGNEGGRPFRQTVTVDTLTEQFEHPYERGIGVRLSRFFEGPLLRLQGGLDYESGRAMLLGGKATQWSVSLALDKHFERSGHSVGLTLERRHKGGPFDVGGSAGSGDDSRLFLRWRYEFGSPFRALTGMRERTVVRTIASPPTSAPPVPPPPPPPPPPPAEVRQVQVDLSSAALFAFDRAELTDRARQDLQPLAQRILRQRVGAVDVVGHTCDLGSEAYNQALSERRAAAVRDWLIAEGVPGSVVSSAGRGELEPELPNDSEANRIRNRRVVLRFSVLEERIVPAAAPPVPPPPPVAPAVPEAPSIEVTELVREPVRLPPAWIDRALRSPIEHKRAVDTYRIVRITESRNEGPREYLNRGPVAVDDQAVVRAGESVVVNVLQNDLDPDGEPLTVTIAAAPAHGTVSIGAGGLVTYTPGGTFVDGDQFRYTITDPHGASATAAVNLTRAPNRAPVAVDDSGTSTDSDPVVVRVLDNDSDPDGDPLTVTITRMPAQGTAVVNADNTITYTPDPTGSGASVTFEYTVRDPGGRTATATVTIFL